MTQINQIFPALQHLSYTLAKYTASVLEHGYYFLYLFCIVLTKKNITRFLFRVKQILNDKYKCIRTYMYVLSLENKYKQIDGSHFYSSSQKHLVRNLKFVQKRFELYKFTSFYPKTSYQNCARTCPATSIDQILSQIYTN